MSAMELRLRAFTFEKYHKVQKLPTPEHLNVSQIASIESENLLTFDGSTSTPSFSLRPCLHYTWSIIRAPQIL